MSPSFLSKGATRINKNWKFLIVTLRRRGQNFIIMQDSVDTLNNVLSWCKFSNWFVSYQITRRNPDTQWVRFFLGSSMSELLGLQLDLCCWSSSLVVVIHSDVQRWEIMQDLIFLSLFLHTTSMIFPHFSLQAETVLTPVLLSPFRQLITPLSSL